MERRRCLAWVWSNEASHKTRVYLRERPFWKHSHSQWDTLVGLPDAKSDFVLKQDLTTTSSLQCMNRRTRREERGLRGDFWMPSHYWCFLPIKFHEATLNLRIKDASDESSGMWRGPIDGPAEDQGATAPCGCWHRWRPGMSANGISELFQY